jgi:hypothetical protein
MDPTTIEQKLEEVRAAAIRNGSPESRNGFQLGDACRLPGVDVTFQVIGLKDESLVDLRAPSGRIVRAGWRALSRVTTPQPGDTP